MPSTPSPIPLHYTPATSAAHSWARYHFHQHQLAAMRDTTSDLYSHQEFSDYIAFPPNSFFSSPAQQGILPTTRYPSSMSRHPTWAFPGYAEQQSTHSAVDVRASSFEPSIVHKVWLLECKHCLTFLTNRGMKVRVDRWLVQRPVI